MSDSFYTISKVSEGFYKEKGSKFLAFAFPVDTVEAVDEHIEELKKKFYDSRHVCFAWRIGPEGENWRTNDAGEPSHSAGDPILNAMKSREVTNALVVVVRYFGGTKLGIGGLVKAYGHAARDALENNEIIEVVPTGQLCIRFPYEMTSEVNRIAHQFNLKPGEASYEADCRQVYDIPLSDFYQVKEKFAEMGILDEK